MTQQNNPRFQNNPRVVSYKDTLQCLLDNIDPVIIHDNNNIDNRPNIVAARFRNKKATGKSVMQKSIERVARTLQIYNRYIITLATSRIWNSSTGIQRQK